MNSQRDDKVQLMYWRGEVLVPGAAALPPRVWRLSRALSQTSWRSRGKTRQWVTLPHHVQDLLLECIMRMVGQELYYKRSLELLN